MSSSIRRNGKDSVMLAQIPRRRGDDGTLRERELSACLNCAPDVHLTDEAQRSLGRIRLKSHLSPTTVRLQLDIHSTTVCPDLKIGRNLVAPRCEELVNSPREGSGLDSR